MVNLGVLFEEAKKGQLTEKQKKPTRHPTKRYKYRESGIRKVSKVYSANYKQGFFFKFLYKENGRKKAIQAKTLKELYERMKEKNINFIIDNPKRAITFFDENCNDEDYKFFMYNIIQGGDKNEP